ncbi:PREDICTED: uncharacterized protein LOC108360183 isoform X1 [Rhagoletis zephyria]|uniref:uncharacterized protein LOC108360183 isoform X1 n=1 Tax=Rhagoletis zephyria TaxID=28612 RepID=UPI000811AA60|nr:PREDICTED: uncharacterized protein LOC108360183 isoform X1 [Rhagoletis zephyria]
MALKIGINNCHIKKCGEIEALMPIEKKEFFLNCGFCEFTFLQLDKFIDHIYEDHSIEFLYPEIKQRVEGIPQELQQSFRNETVSHSKVEEEAVEVLEIHKSDIGLEDKSDYSIKEEIIGKMEQYICKVWSADRTVKKTFMSEGTTDAIITAASNYGIRGNKIVLECDGTEICGDDVLKYYLNEKATLMMLADEEWCTQRSIEILSNDVIQPKHANQQQEQFLLMTADTAVESYVTSKVATSDSFSSSSETGEPAKQHFKNFSIPWHKVPSDLMNLLNTQQKLGKRLNTLANCIVDELRMYSSFIPMCILRSVTREAVAKFPASLLEKDCEGNIISVTTIPLLTIMRNRNNFLNRAPNPKSCSLTPNIPLAKRRRTNVLKTTCSNWQPVDLISPETIATLNKKKKYLMNLYKMQSDFQSMELIKSHMKDCFPLQRSNFNEMDPSPTIESIKRDWPYIFSTECLNQHFGQLMNTDPDLFDMNFNKNREETAAFFEHLQGKHNLLKEAHQTNYIIKSIAKYFNENANYLFAIFEIGANLDTIVEKVPTNTPFVAFVENDVEKETYNCYIFIEKTLVSHTLGDGDMFKFLKQIIQYYFVFNIIYPPETSQTMEFFVRFFYKFYPNSSRGAKKNINNIQKVNNLIVKLTNFQINNC